MKPQEIENKIIDLQNYLVNVCIYEDELNKKLQKIGEEKEQLIDEVYRLKELLGDNEEE